MIEPFTVLATANAAYKTLKGAISNGREIADYAGVLGKFWEAKEELSELEQLNNSTSLIEKTFGAKSVEAQALQITLHKNKIATLEKDLHELFVWSGNGGLWKDMMKERRNIRNMRAREAKEKANRRKFMYDLAGVFIILLLLGALTSLIFFIFTL